MKKVVFVLFVIISVLYFFQYSRFPAADTANSLSKLNKALKNNSILAHEDLYQEELQKLAFRLKQEPYLQLNQRYSRKILASATANNETDEIVHAEQTIIKTVISSTKTLKYTIQRIEQLSGSFKQAKIYATLNGSDKSALQKLCRRIREQYVEYNSLVICLYSETETGIALAKGENVHYSQQDILNTWLVFYSYHPVEGDYFDAEPGKYWD
tara:strand:- start:241 stop:876 length:636 start_codon:yes stop_codon:yes gene_type:complete